MSAGWGDSRENICSVVGVSAGVVRGGGQGGGGTRDIACISHCPSFDVASLQYRDGAIRQEVFAGPRLCVFAKIFPAATY